MAKEKIMLNDLFSWQDIINLCLTDYRFGCSFLKKSCSKKNHEYVLENHIRTFIGNILREKFPDFPFDDECFNYYFCIKKDDQNKLYLSFSDFFSDLLNVSVNTLLDKKKFANLLKSSSTTLKEDIIKELRICKDDINKEIDKCSNNLILMNYNPEYNVVTSKEEYKDILFKKRKMILWIIRHYDELESFVHTPLNLDIFKLLNKDKFMLIMMSFALRNASILGDDELSAKQDNINIVNNYILLIDYLNSENDQKYYASFSSKLGNGQELLITTDTIISQYQQFCDDNREFVDSCNFATTYEELLQKKAMETWKNIQNKKLAKKIKLNWEMIPTGNKISLSNYQLGAKAKIISADSDKQAKLQKDYDLVEEKIDYFSKTNPLFELTGIDTFEGYSAYMYQNGVVVFEKYFKQTKEKKGTVMMIPVSGEAIYVMNFQEFADLSKYTKMELIQEIRDFNNPDIKRIYHTLNGSWKDKISKIINGPGYGMLDLQQIDVLANELVSETKQKIKRVDE